MLIYGASGHGQEIANLARVSGFLVHAFVDDSLNGDSILTQEDALKKYPSAEVLLGAGYPKIRRRMSENSKLVGFKPFSKLVHPKVELAETIRLGVGVIIASGCVLTVNIQIGNHTHLNLGCTVNHDVSISDFVTLSPGVHVCGNVVIESDVFVGAGAVIINGRSDSPLVIGQGSIIGAGACVTYNVPAGETWVGVPARKIK